MSSEWARLQIKQLGRIVTGKTPSTSRPELFGGNIPFLTPTDMTDGVKVVSTSRYLTQAGLSTVKNCLVPKGVAVSCIGWQMGKSVLVLEPTVTNQQINTVVVDESRFDLNFVYYLMTSMREKIFQYGATATRTPIVNKSSFGELGILVPCLSEQKRIAAFFSALDDRIALLRGTNTTLEAIAQALFKSWFVDFDPVHANAAFIENGQAPSLPAEIQALFPSRLVESPQGPIPEGWEVKRCSEIIDVRDGTHASPKASETGYPLLTSKHITSGELLFDGAYLISETDYLDISKRSKVDQLDVLITMIGTVGVTAFVLNESTDFAIKNIGLFKTSQRPEFASYMYLLLSSREMKHYLEARMAGTTQKYLSLKALREIAIIEPAKPVIETFSELVKPIFEKIHQNRTSVQTLSTLRDTLLPRLISGQLRLPEAEAALAEVG